MTTSVPNATNPNTTASETAQRDSSWPIRIPNRSLFINSIYGKNKKYLRTLILEMYDELKELENNLDRVSHDCDEIQQELWDREKDNRSMGIAIINKFCEEYDPEYGKR